MTLIFSAGAIFVSKVWELKLRLKNSGVAGTPNNCPKNMPRTNNVAFCFTNAASKTFL